MTVDAAVIEWTWTGVAAGGLLVQAMLVRWAVGNLTVVYAYGVNGGKRALGWEHVINGLGLLAVHTMFLTIGVWALRQPNAPLPVTIDALLVPTLLTAASITLVAVGLNSWRCRWRLLQTRNPKGDR